MSFNKTSMNHNELGVYGEKLAQEYLLKKGYQHLHYNYRFGRNEIDIVSLFRNKIVVTEVKTKSSYEIVEPWKSVTRQKQKQIVKVADAYIQTLNMEYDVQFDIVSIIVYNDLTSAIEHFEDAFSAM